jgi:hypothetical protein
MTSVTIGITVRPVSNGEDLHGRPIQWTQLKGRVIDLYQDCGELRAEVRWQQKAPYPSCLPVDWLEPV